jgi:hypothetical protein
MSFAAFKVLPIDPTRTQREGTVASTAATVAGSAFVVIVESVPDDLASTSTCQEVVDLMVDAIVCACADTIARACTDAHAQAAADSGKAKAKGKAKGNVVVPFVRKEDIVRSVAPTPFFFGSSLTFARLTYLTLVGDDFSLAEVQKMTSMYTKMEYGVEWLLWLG